MIRTWFVPAWNGDWRLEPEGDTTLLTIEKPTADEKRMLAKLATKFVDKKWITDVAADKIRSPGRLLKTRVTLHAPLAEIGPYVASLLRPGENVITAVRFKGGKIEVAETSTMRTDEEDSPSSGTPYRDNHKTKDEKKTAIEEKPAAVKVANEPTKESVALAKRPDAEAAATVQRPTPCCPNCFTDMAEVNKPATECLLAFLDADEHEMWARERYVIVRGGITGHRYRIAHRNSPIAEKQTRLCWDLDDDALMHFHNWVVPPEEEVLATMLILKHREPWLRNEATALGGEHRHIFKNPFGGGGDGVEDSTWTSAVGRTLMKFLGVQSHTRPPRALNADGELVDTTGAILTTADGSLYSEDGYDA